MTTTLPVPSISFGVRAKLKTAIWGKVKFPSYLEGFVEFMQKGAMWTSTEGALTLLYLGVQTDQLKDKDIRGKYYHPQTQEVINKDALPEKRQDDLWKFLDELVVGFV